MKIRYNAHVSKVKYKMLKSEYDETNTEILNYNAYYLHIFKCMHVYYKHIYYKNKYYTFFKLDT